MRLCGKGIMRGDNIFFKEIRFKTLQKDLRVVGEGVYDKQENQWTGRRTWKIKEGCRQETGVLVNK
jgi:hypothetical protein